MEELRKELVEEMVEVEEVVEVEEETTEGEEESLEKAMKREMESAFLKKYFVEFEADEESWKNKSGECRVKLTPRIIEPTIMTFYLDDLKHLPVEEIRTRYTEVMNQDEVEKVKKLIEEETGASSDHPFSALLIEVIKNLIGETITEAVKFNKLNENQE